MTNQTTECRGCGEHRLLPVLSLGKTPLANRLLTAEDLQRPEPTYPLDLVFCPACSLVQITETVPPAELFREYVYFSSFSDAMVQHAATLVQRIISERKLTSATVSDRNRQQRWLSVTATLPAARHPSAWH